MLLLLAFQDLILIANYQFGPLLFFSQFFAWEEFFMTNMRESYIEKSTLKFLGRQTLTMTVLFLQKNGVKFMTKSENLLTPETPIR